MALVLVPARQDAKGDEVDGWMVSDKCRKRLVLVCQGAPDATRPGPWHALRSGAPPLVVMSESHFDVEDQTSFQIDCVCGVIVRLGTMDREESPKGPGNYELSLFPVGDSL